MKLLRISVLLLLSALTCSSALGQTTQSFTASKANEYGLVYALPNTVVDITIETEHTKLTPGEFYNYSRRHLAINDAITEPSTSVKVKSVTLNCRGEANDKNKWLVQFKAGSSVTMRLTPDGSPLSINNDSIVVAPVQDIPEAIAIQPTVLESEMALQAMTQDMIRSSSISKRAELSAQRIFELRDIRNELLSGSYDNPPADGQAMKLVLDNLSGQEAALTAMFIGTSQTWTTVKTVTICPDTTNVYKKVLARVSPTDGVLEPDNLAGAPIYMSIEVIERGQLPVNELGIQKTFPKGGVAYTIPGKARLTISYEGETLLTTELTLAQLGCTFGIDPKLFSDKKAPSALLFDPITGGILHLGIAL